MIQQLPQPMDIGALPKGKGRGEKGHGQPKGKGKGKDQPKGKKSGQQGGAAGSSEKLCFYCNKPGHVKAECRKKAADEKAAGKGAGQQAKAKAKAKTKAKPTAALPEEEPEPLSAAYVAATVADEQPTAVALLQEVLVDTGAGAHLFKQGFDPAAEVGQGISKEMVTVTGEKIPSARKKKSLFGLQGKGTLSVEYAESDKVKFSVLSAGEAATKGLWTVIGPNTQCVVGPQHAQNLKEALKKTTKLELTKRNGVFWLPVDSQPAGRTAAQDNLVAAARAAKKTVPAELLDKEDEVGPDPGLFREEGLRGEVEGEVQGDRGLEGEEAQAQPGLNREALEGPPPEADSERPKAVRRKKIPPTVSKEEYDSHMLTHLPYRSWCDFCVSGKCREDGHYPRVQSEVDVPVISLDYCFLGRVLENEPKTVEELKEPSSETEGAIPVLVVYDHKTGATFSGVVNKGVDGYAQTLVKEALKFCGRQRVVLMTDGENSIKALAEASAKEWGKEAAHQVAPKGSHQSNGAVERAILEVARQVRTLTGAIEARFSGFKLSVEDNYFPWVVRHASWLITRFLVKVDGKTPYERLRGRDFKGEIVEQFEVVHYKLEDKGKADPQTAVEFWLGKTLSSDEHVLGTPEGIRKCRSAFRRPEGRRWDRTILDRMKGLPWQPKGEPIAVRGKPAPATPGRRGVYITVDRQIRHGSTPGCPGCSTAYGENPKPHNAECRARFEAILGRVPDEDPVPSTPAGRTADVEMGSAEGTATPVETKADKEPAAKGKARKSAGDTATGSAGRSATKRAGSSATVRDVPPEGATSQGSGLNRSGAQSSEDPTAKKARASEARGQKRELEEVPMQGGEGGDDPTLYELIGGLPTIHEQPPVAAYPEWGRLAEAYDERTGELLPTEKVKKARGRELDKMVEHNVKTDITWEQARSQGLKIVRSRWVDGWKALPDDPHGVRSRCVAQEVATTHRDDVFSGTPPLKAHRMVVSAAATSKKGRTSRRRLIARYDVSVAFFHAVATGKIAVVPPKDVNNGLLWFLLKAMNGTREASKQWAKRILEVMLLNDFSEVPSVPGLFYHPDRDITLSCHGDDFLAEGESDDLDWLDEIMVKNFETKVLPRIGDPAAGGQVASGTHLRRIIKWTDKGFTWEADPKHAQVIVKELGLEGAKGVDSPSSTDTGKNQRNLDAELDSDEASKFRQLAGTALYLSLDRPSIQFAVSEIASGMSKPTVLHQLKLKRLARYLISYPRETWEFIYQECPSEVTVLTDSDWASCKTTRKSVSSLSERFGSHLLDASCAKQSVVALSSGEAEFYAIARGAAAGRMTKQIWDKLGFPGLPLVIRTDSSAAKGIATRKGVGKVKHLSLKELWVQDHVQKGNIKVVKEPTASNWADLGTKSLSGKRIEELMKIMPLRRGLCAALIAGCLQLVSAQPSEEPKADLTGWWIYFIAIHLLLLWFLFTGIIRWCRSPSRVTHEVGTWTGGDWVPENVPVNRQYLRRRTPDVYVTRQGRRYHNRSCADLARVQRVDPAGVHTLSLQQAEASGFTPCARCTG